MDKLLRFNLIFIGGCIGAGILACIGTAFGMVQVIFWQLSNCGKSTACSGAELLLSYWWLMFVPGCLAAAYFLRRAYDRRYAVLMRGE